MPHKPDTNSLTSIVAVGLDGAIGVENRLPWQLKSDLQFFKRTTKGNVIMMGRKTYDSLGKCLPLRENVVLSHTPSLFPPHEGCHHVHSIAEALSLRTKWKSKRAFVIGGAQTYRQFAPYVDRYLITVVRSRFPDADAFFDQSILGDEDEWARSELKVDRIGLEDADEFDFQVFELKHRDADAVAERRSRLIEAFHARNHLHRPKRQQEKRLHEDLAQPRSLFA